MTSIVSFVTVFMATFVLAFGYMSYSEQEEAMVVTEPPEVAVSESDR